MAAPALSDTVLVAGAIRLHRALEQLRRQVMLRTAQLFAGLNPNALAETYPAYAAATLAYAEAPLAQAAYTATETVLETILTAGHTPLALPEPRSPKDDFLRTLEHSGPRRIEKFIEDGHEAEFAHAMAMRRAALGAGETIFDHANRQSQVVIKGNQRIMRGLRRVANPGACAFCRILAGATDRYPVYNVSDAWVRPHPNCHCVIIALPLYRTERIKTPAEIDYGRAAHYRIKAAKDRARARAAGQALPPLPPLPAKPASVA